MIGNKGALLITHDKDEALVLAHRILVAEGLPLTITKDLPVGGSLGNRKNYSKRSIRRMKDELFMVALGGAVGSDGALFIEPNQNYRLFPIDYHGHQYFGRDHHRRNFLFTVTMR